MLIEFRFKNYRSFRDEAILSMEAIGLGSKKDCLIHYKSQKILKELALNSFLTHFFLLFIHNSACLCKFSHL